MTVETENLKLDGDSVTSFGVLLEKQYSLLEVQKEQATSWLSVFPSSLVGYIETFSSGTLNLIKELNQYQLEVVRGSDVYQDLKKLSAGVMVLKKTVGNDIQGSFPDLWSSVNDL